jgi:hypothetical protein
MRPTVALSPAFGEVFSTLAVPFAVMVGLVTLIFTVPVMGEFK